jgi:hypothetical protein
MSAKTVWISVIMPPPLTPCIGRPLRRTVKLFADPKIKEPLPNKITVSIHVQYKDRELSAR